MSIYSYIYILIKLILKIAIMDLKINESNKTSQFGIPKNEDLYFTEESHRLLEREIATQTMVLAKNNDILPIRPTDQVVLFGDGTINTIYGGWGSGEVYNRGTTQKTNIITVLEGIENKKDKFIYIKNEIGYLIGKGINGDRILTDEDIKNFSLKKDGVTRSIAILTISRISGEGKDRAQNSGNDGILLSDSEIKTYNALIQFFDNIVIILNVCSVIELNGIQNEEKTSILISFLPGIEAGNAIADILIGDAYPSAHLTDTWAKTINDYPSTSTFNENQRYVNYKEGLFVGYRYFEEDEEKQSKVVFPFGHGLSYTKFNLENNCEFNKDTNIFTVHSKVTNIGDRPGKQVVQVYVKKPHNKKLVKAQRELVAFNKTKELEKGESQILKLTFNLNYLSSYDDIGVTGNNACYILEPGEYKIFVGDSVAATRNDSNLVYIHNQNELVITEKLTNFLIPSPDVMKENLKAFNYNKEKNVIINSNNTLPTNKFNKINFKSVLEGKYSMEQLVDSMTNEELAYLSYGKKSYIRSGCGIIGGQYNSGITGKYNIPSGDTCDGPAGLRQSEEKMGSTAWPCSTALASSFDIELIKKVGEETGKEARKIGCAFWLSPGMNIHRNPLCGRNFEYYSEDPFLSGKMAAAITKGVQSKRVSVTLKHFMGNNKEDNRNGNISNGLLASDSIMSERVAREIYLKGFEIAVKEGKPWAIMSSYNRINGIKASKNPDLLIGILRNEWHFDGFVMTDWGTSSEIDQEAHAGSSVKMPKGNIEKMISGINKGTVTRDDLKRNILFLLNSISKIFIVDNLFLEQPKNKININDEYIKIKIMENIYRKSDDISYEKCKDEDGGFNPTYTWSGNWISIYIDNKIEGNRSIKIRYSAIKDGFGIRFRKYEENLGEISNLQKTGDWQKWSTSPAVDVRLPYGSYELTMEIFGGGNKGNINYIEILASKSFSHSPNFV